MRYPLLFINLPQSDLVCIRYEITLFLFPNIASDSIFYHRHQTLYFTCHTTPVTIDFLRHRHLHRHESSVIVNRFFLKSSQHIVSHRQNPSSNFLGHRHWSSSPIVNRFFWTIVIYEFWRLWKKWKICHLCLLKKVGVVFDTCQRIWFYNSSTDIYLVKTPQDLEFTFMLSRSQILCMNFWF